MAKKKKAKESSLQFEEELARLETLVAELEDGEIPLSEALSKYEEGVKHLRACYQLLEKAERKIELLKDVDQDGNPVTEPFDEQEDASLEEKGASRSQKRTRKSKTGKEKPASGGSESGDTSMDGDARLF